MNTFVWTPAIEAAVLNMRRHGNTYAAIAESIGATSNSVKHKVRRLGQADNKDRYKHTAEKEALFLHTNEAWKKKLSVLETHCGFGGMTEVYARHADEVLALDIDAERVQHAEK